MKQEWEEVEERKKIIALCVANFLFSFGLYVNVVFLFYIPKQFGVSEFYTGMIISLLSIALFLGTIIYPYIAKRIPILVIYRWAITINIVVYIIAGIFYSKLLIVVLLTTIGYIMLSLTRILNKKLIAISSSGKLRKQAFSYLFAASNFGGIFSGIFAVIIFEQNISNMRYIYFITAFFLLLSFVLIHIGLRGDKYYTLETNSNRLLKGSVFKRFNFKMLIGIGGLYFGVFQIVFLLPKSIEFNYSLKIYSLFIVINTISCVIAAPLLSKLFLKRREHHILLLSGTMFIVSFILYNIINLPYMIIATIIFTIGEVLLATNVDSYLLTVYDSNDYDTLLVIVRMFSQGARVLSPVIAAYFITYYSYEVAFIFVILIISISMLLLLHFEKFKKD